MGEVGALSVGLFVFGYPAAIAVIARWVPVVRERRVRWFVVHQFAVTAIVVGWVLRSRWPAVTINATWLVTAAAWYALKPRLARRSSRS
jgi:hypothetical protein